MEMWLAIRRLRVVRDGLTLCAGWTPDGAAMPRPYKGTASLRMESVLALASTSCGGFVRLGQEMN